MCATVGGQEHVVRRILSHELLLGRVFSLLQDKADDAHEGPLKSRCLGGKSLKT